MVVYVYTYRVNYSYRTSYFGVSGAGKQQNMSEFVVFVLMCYFSVNFETVPIRNSCHEPLKWGINK